MTKPVDTEEMLLRIQALLRRSQIVSARKLVVGKIILDFDTLTVTRDNEKQTLPQKEFHLLYKLLSYPERIFTRIQLMDEIWGWTVRLRTLRLMYISTDCGNGLKTIRNSNLCPSAVSDTRR